VPYRGRGQRHRFGKGWRGNHGRRLRGYRLSLAADTGTGQVITFVLAPGRTRDHRMAALLARPATSGATGASGVAVGAAGAIGSTSGATRALGTVEALEHPRQLLRRDALACVAYVDPHRVRLRRDGHDDGVAACSGGPRGRGCLDHGVPRPPLVLALSADTFVATALAAAP
jgi:hypothetical protein